LRLEVLCTWIQVGYAVYFHPEVEVEVLSGAAELAIQRELSEYYQYVLCAVQVSSCWKGERDPWIN
jgi:hypothetical protein